MMKIRTIISMLLFSLLVGGVYAPVLVYAKNNGDRGDRGNQVRSEQNTLGDSIRTWVKQDLEDIHNQVGDQIKTTGMWWGGWGWGWGRGGRWGNASSTTDTIAPVITNVRSWPLARSVFISWTTDESADSAVFWNTTSPVDVNSSSTPHREQGRQTRTHQMLIPRLSATTTYYAIVRSRDRAGNTAYSPQFSFTTHGRGTSTPPVSDVIPPLISSVGFIVGTSTMNVSWTTDEAASSRVFYSTSTPVTASTTTTSFIESSALVTSHSLLLSGLSTSTLYYIRVQSADAAGNTQTSGEFSTTTAGL